MGTSVHEVVGEVLAVVNADGDAAEAHGNLKKVGTDTEARAEVRLVSLLLAPSTLPFHVCI
jgi:hypothetical protein